MHHVDPSQKLADPEVAQEPEEIIKEDIRAGMGVGGERARGAGGALDGSREHRDISAALLARGSLGSAALPVPHGGVATHPRRASVCVRVCVD